MTFSLAVIQFPGSNCEYETARAAQAFGFNTHIIRWNCPETEFKKYDAYILSGGFSYQDRIRSGAIAAKLPIMHVLFEADQMGKPILGICNGCQILAETGLIPNLNDSNAIQVSLSHNTLRDQACGFICDWVFVRIKNPEKSVFTGLYTDTDIIPIPINHGEGKFTLSPEIQAQLNNFTVLYYCSDTGEITNNYPVNPNGTFANIAGIANKRGNVLALMPHPERAAFLKQIPTWISSPWADKKRNQATQTDADGPWKPLFDSIQNYLTGRNKS